MCKCNILLKVIVEIENTEGENFPIQKIFHQFSIFFRKQAKKTKNAFFACFRPYVGQPDNHFD